MPKPDIVVKENDERITKYKQQIKDDTNNSLTDTEYGQIAQIKVWLEDYEKYERQSGGPGEIDPGLVQQARLYRSLLIQHVGKSRPSKKREEDFLSQIKKELTILQENGELPDYIPWVNADKESLLEKIRRAEEEKNVG